MARIRVVSLFCGCGGMDLGVIGGFSFLGKSFERNNAEIVYAVDNDPYCTQIYNANFEHKCVVKDVRDITMDEIPECDILIGGFPCQSFSISAQNPPRLGYKDERGMLFFEMVKILKERKPRFFIAENVKGILSANKKKAFPMIIKEFSDAGYHVTYKLLNSSDYGVPQKRERVIIVGFKELEDFRKFSFPQAVSLKERKVLRDVIMEEANHDEKLFFSEKAVAGMMAVREKMNKGRIQELDEPCNTISSHLAKVSLNSTDPVYFVNGRYRRFSCDEAARIQSFPENFNFTNLSQGRKYKAIGNAVPPVMMWYIVNSVLKISDKVKDRVKYAACDNARQLDFISVLEKYPDEIVNNGKQENESLEDYELNLDTSKNVLVSLVKNDNMEQYLDRSAKIYYTGRKFPSTVKLNKLYYFMPYTKRKGIRDLYLIKVARVGTKHEVRPEADENDLRLVFEIEFVKQLFDDYKPHRLKIWETFTDTTLEELIQSMK
ncbi:MAG: DNA (cytosine-5-)-methyltransferase [Bacteroides sp.]|nr:DNA (cytosine-5-)-methyltransferase [Bacteroides sp.]MBP3668892.1 DNA (cytosine-5-)-methyltransferase [Bacteroides sp.]